ncbi:MAG: family 16 glycosylhydrolase [Sphingobacteriales bacterium]
MKTSTKYSFLYMALGLLTLGGCKKLDGTKDGSGGTTKTGNVSPYTNPNTAAATCDYDFNETDLTNSGWTKVFDDEFTGDLSNWGAQDGGLIKEEQCYLPANAQIVNGALQITAKKETVTGPTSIGSQSTSTFDYTSGWLVSKQSFAANSNTPKVRIVARIKVASGYGLTSYFFTYGNGAWPTAGEIDNVEVQGDNTKVFATDYSYGPSANVNTVSGGIEYNPTTEDLSSCYHVYTMEWTQNALTTYLDGKLVETKTKGGQIANLFGKPQQLSLSLPIGGEFYNNLNVANIKVGTMYVDYVKVFTSN